MKPATAEVQRNRVESLGLVWAVRSRTAVKVSGVSPAVIDGLTRCSPLGVTMRTTAPGPKALIALLAAAGLAQPWAARADPVLVAVAANFAGPLAKLAEGFTAATGHSLSIVAGATGKFYSQIAAGAPFEVLIAADEETPKKLIHEGLAVAGSNFTYAIGVLVLWSATPGYVDGQGAVLAAGKFNKLAIANPKLAPYGRAGMEVLKARGLNHAVAPKLVTAESIAQAYQFVASGSAELGFVALSQVSLPGKAGIGSYWRVPASQYGEIRQDALLLKPGEKRPAAAALLAYLKSAPARAVIQAYGYGP